VRAGDRRRRPARAARRLAPPPRVRDRVRPMKPRRRRPDVASIPPRPLTRGWALTRLDEDPFDVVVVGGGITGAYAALDAAQRGYRVALLEKDDFASGTSSK